MKFGFTRIFGSSASLVLAVGLLASLFVPAEAQSETVLPQYSKNIHLGVTSCAGSTCHGATTPWPGSTVLQTEYVTWSQKDAHAKAYSVLHNDASKRIAANLGLKNAHEADICLDCHADNVASNKRSRVFQLSDGVGCEACHGGAQSWLGLHVSGIASHADNVKAGMFPTEDPVKRAELCLSCHFGNDKKFVTHKIMGAGHPRISFELDTFTAIQPAHFEIDDDYRKRKHVANGIQTWAIGQAMALERRLDAMLDPKTGQDGIFPELVFFDCQACHHSLTEPRWQPRPSTGLGPGVVRFDDSNLLMLRIITSALDPDMGRMLGEKTKKLHEASQVSMQDFHTAAKDLKNATKDMVKIFAAHKFGKADVTTLLKGLVQEAAAAEYSDYAGAEQAVMAISAVLDAAAKMGMKSESDAAQGQLDVAFKALQKYDDWDHEALKRAIVSLKIPE